MGKKMVRRQIHEAYLNFDGYTLDQAIENLEGLKENHGEDLFFLEYSDWDDVSTLGLFKEELESDAEYDARMSAESKYQEYRKQHYEKLKKEFGDT